MKNALLIFLSILLFSCEKSELTDLRTTGKYKVDYFITADSAQLSYSLHGKLYKRLVTTSWDTTVYTTGGWNIELYVRSYTEIIQAGYKVNGVIIDGCTGGYVYESVYYLEPL